MIYKGYVVKLEKDFAVVITDQMEYLQIVKKDGLAIGKEVLFVKEDLYRAKKLKWIKSTAVAAALFFIICSMALFSKFQNYDEVFALVSIDMNPSIELELNSEQQVIRAVPLNSKGKKILTRDLNGFNIEKALDFIFHKAKEMHYITSEENDVFVAVVMIHDHTKAQEEEFKEEIHGKVQKTFDDQTNLFYLEGQITKEDLKKARKNEISTGKYEVFKSLEKAGKGVTLEQVKKMNIQEMKKEKMLQQSKKDERKEKKDKEDFSKGNSQKGQPKPVQKVIKKQKTKDDLIVVKEHKKVQYKEKDKGKENKERKDKEKKKDSQRKEQGVSDKKTNLIREKSKTQQKKENPDKKEKRSNKKTNFNKEERQHNKNSPAKEKWKK
jgi:hypothetical protein